jgi:hypothetical protein
MAVRLKRRETEVFSLSFLDCICCGFGAIILLLVISEFGEPVVIEKSRKDLQAQVLALQKQLFEIRGETDQLNRIMRGRVDLLEEARLNLARAAGEMSKVRGQFSASRTDSSVSTIIESELTAAFQSLSIEQQKLLAKSRERRRIRTEAVGGIPVDSQYIIFLIDTSGSMQGSHWETAIEVMREVLDIYPSVKGLQIVDDNGKEMLGGTRGTWLRDSPEIRKRVVQSMRGWATFSDSDPADGIEIAIKNYWAPDKRISLYVLGDEFTGKSIQAALDSVARVNRADDQGRRRVRIHSIGFPEGGMAPFTNIRFSALMRAMCEQNNGTFVGITNEKSCAVSIDILGRKTCVGSE